MSKAYPITNKLLDGWIKHNYNVLFEGEHGTGKSATVLSAFKRNNLNYLYFSAATMDPWVDFIGVPREVKDENEVPYLELIRPRNLRDDTIDAIFFDELNRAPKKVRNAVMELIQFKSINGRQFKRLRFIWAAINPDSGEYDTEGLDPAQRDRFQIQVKMPWEINYEYFKEKYDSGTAEVVSAWWNAIPEDIRKLVSPRRVDYAIQALRDNIDIRGYVLDEKSGVSKLIADLKSGPAIMRFRDVFDKNDDTLLKEFLSDQNNLADVESEIFSKRVYIERCIQAVPPEIQMSVFANYALVRNHILSNAISFKGTLENISKLSQTPEYKKVAEVALLDLANKNSAQQNVSKTILKFDENTVKNLGSLYDAFQPSFTYQRYAYKWSWNPAAYEVNPKVLATNNYYMRNPNATIDYGSYLHDAETAFNANTFKNTYARKKVLTSIWSICDERNICSLAEFFTLCRAVEHILNRSYTYSVEMRNICNFIVSYLLKQGIEMQSIINMIPKIVNAVDQSKRDSVIYVKS